MDPLVTRLPLDLEKPSPEDKRADKERVLAALKKAGLSVPADIGPEILRTLPGLLRDNDFSLTATVGYVRDRAKVVDLQGASSYGIAVDIGTTNIAASLFDMANTQKLDVMEYENPQIEIGPDVLTRVHSSMQGEGARLHRLLINGINALIHKLCNAHAIDCSDIHAAAIAGNTIMTHFLLALPVDNISVAPYTPVANRMDFAGPGEIGLDMNRSGVVYIFPNAGSYVGGDIISGILSSGLYLEEEPSFLIDVGTNAEIVLGCREWMIVGAGAAGPALEGGISEIGMRAIQGAIYSVEVNNPPVITSMGKGGFNVTCKVIGNGEPVGICGSGMIELVAELYRSDILNQQGRLNRHSHGVEEKDGARAFVLYESGRKKLAVRESDIDNFLRSKAAMFTSLFVIVKAVGLGFKDIQHIYVSGAFGTGINTDKAIRIGMMPDLERSKFIPAGNSSLKGAEMLLADRGLLQRIDRICDMITYREMNTDGVFMKEFPGALFIPHTNPEILGS